MIAVSERCAYTKQHFRVKQRSRRWNTFKENTLSSVKYKALPAELRTKAPSTLLSEAEGDPGSALRKESSLEKKTAELPKGRVIT